MEPKRSWKGSEKRKIKEASWNNKNFSGSSQ